MLIKAHDSSLAHPQSIVKKELPLAFDSLTVSYFFPDYIFSPAMESTSNNALVEEDIRLGGITNLFGHLELDHAENGQGRFDCVWCTISALIDMSPFDMQLCLPEEERPVTHRGIEQDGMKHRGLSDDEIKRLLIAVDKNIM